MLLFFCTWSLILYAHAHAHASGQRELKSACLVLFFQSLPFANPVSNADDVSFDPESVAHILALVKSMRFCY